MTVDWRTVRRLPTAEIVRDRRISLDAARGVLWGAEAGVHELSAYGEWTGANLLCNAFCRTTARRVLERMEW
jgi:hypothetical protein